VIRAATSTSLGEAHSSKLEDEIREIIRSSEPAAGNIHHLHVHTYGDHREVTIHIGFPAGMTVQEAHQMAGKVKYALKEKLGLEITVHLEPLET
jgi:divalent metal cation (Fe/Co/Zn/Cd) transporter